MNNNLNFTICEEKIDQIIKELPNPSINFNENEVCDSSKHLLEDFKCQICFNIPTECKECSNCEALFCEYCVIKHKNITNKGRNKTQCPSCRQVTEFKKINRRLGRLYSEMIQFDHVCTNNCNNQENEQHIHQEEECIQENPRKRQRISQDFDTNNGRHFTVGNFEKSNLFEIETKDVETLNESSYNTNDTQIQQSGEKMFRMEQNSNYISQFTPQKDFQIDNFFDKPKNIFEQDFTLKKIQENNIEIYKQISLLGNIENPDPVKPLTKRRYTYAKMVTHMKEHHHEDQKVHSCPLDCNCAENGAMSKDQLIEHLRNQCPKMDIKCTTCDGTMMRQYQRFHKSDQCIQELIRQNESLDASIKQKETEIEDAQNPQQSQNPLLLRQQDGTGYGRRGRRRGGIINGSNGVQINNNEIFNRRLSDIRQRVSQNLRDAFGLNDQQETNNQDTVNPQAFNQPISNGLQLQRQNATIFHDLGINNRNSLLVSANGYTLTSSIQEYL